MGFFVPPEFTRDKPGLEQGDILKSIPFSGFSISRAWVVQPGEPEPVLRDLTSDSIHPQSQLVASVEFSYGIILTQSCDLIPRKNKPARPVLIAKIVPWAREPKYPRLAEQSNFDKCRGKLEDLKNPGKAPTVFYLPDDLCILNGKPVPWEKSNVHLLEVQTFPPEDLDALKNLLHLRLSKSALQAFQERLAYCFGRFGAPDELYYNASEWQKLREIQFADTDQRCGPERKLS